MTRITKHMTTEQFRTALGKRLVALRKERGSDQSEFAAALGMSQGQLSRYENGRADLTVVRLDQICRALGTTAAKVLEGLT